MNNELTDLFEQTMPQFAGNTFYSEPNVEHSVSTSKAFPSLLSYPGENPIVATGSSLLIFSRNESRIEVAWIFPPPRPPHPAPPPSLRRPPLFGPWIILTIRLPSPCFLFYSSLWNSLFFSTSVPFFSSVPFLIYPDVLMCLFLDQNLQWIIIAKCEGIVLKLLKAITPSKVKHFENILCIFINIYLYSWLY